MQTKEILDELNDEQKEAVTYNDGPLLVVAGAGTGKTKVIISKIAYLISEKLAKPEEILAISFTKKAAGEMQGRVDEILPYGYADVKICNFHSFAEEFLRENAYGLGFSTSFKVLTQPQQILFIKDHIFDLNLKKFRPLSDPTYFIKDLISLFSRLKDDLIGPEEYLKFATELENKADSKIEKERAEEQMELARAYNAYQELLALNDKMDFGDLIFKTVEAIKNNEKLLQKLQTRYKYILVDEFQDTNYGQNELLKVITLSKNQKSKIKNQKLGVASPQTIEDNPKNLQLTTYNLPQIIVVGDDDQSIYKFRGASLSNILEFKENWKNVKEVVLIQNYRNTQEILDASYRLISNNTERLEKKYGINKKLISNTGKGEKPILLDFKTASEEADGIAEEIQTIKQESKKTKKQEINWSDFAILIRSNNFASPIINALTSKKIPHVFSGSEGLFRKTVIKNAISFLSILTNPTDNFALFNLLTSEILEVDFDKLSILLHKTISANISLEQYLREKMEEKDIGSGNFNKIKKILETIDKIRRESFKHNAGEIVYQFLNDSGYLKKLSTEEKNGSIEAGEKIISLANFFDKILDFQENTLDISIQKFMEYLNILLEFGDDVKDEMDGTEFDAVRILTVHAAKGLEFKNVFIAGLSNSRFPTSNKSDKLEFPEELSRDERPFVSTGDNKLLDEKTLHLEEERRLFYVGMTRAAEKLYFTFGRDYGGKKSTKISIFVVEAIGQENIKKEFFEQSPLERIIRFEPKKELLHSTRLKLKEDKLRLSRAEVDDYLTCPRKYKYIHITPIRLMTDPRVIFGRAVHKVIEELYKARLNHGELTPNQLLEIYKQNWSSEGFLSQEHEIERFNEGIEVIKRFYSEYADKIKVLEIEKKFKFEIENNIIEGRIDAIEDLGDGNIGIIDFKTSVSQIDQDTADKRARDSNQLAVYALAMQEIEGKLPMRTGLFFLESGVLGAFVPNTKAIDGIKEKIIRASEGIRAQNFTATPDAKTCEMCPFSRYCDDSAV
ncbi:MAG: ATP-dependent DNA helicase [Patescibacteria group bacterium]|nr:ATP-dependent DNA helicase [Patescibacteria group bacterium]